jgi:hypothetical protein
MKRDKRDYNRARRLRVYHLKQKISILLNAFQEELTYPEDWQGNDKVYDEDCL